MPRGAQKAGFGAPKPAAQGRPFGPPPGAQKGGCDLTVRGQ